MGYNRLFVLFSINGKAAKFMSETFVEKLKWVLKLPSSLAKKPLNRVAFPKCYPPEYYLNTFLIFRDFVGGGMAGLPRNVWHGGAPSL